MNIVANLFGAGQNPFSYGLMISNSNSSPVLTKSIRHDNRDHQKNALQGKEITTTIGFYGVYVINIILR